MSAWDDRRIDVYDPPPPALRAKYIDGGVETEEQKADRERKQIKKVRKELADETKNARWGLDDAQHRFRLMRLGLGAGAVVGCGIVVGWVVAISWGMLANFSGGRGGPLTFFMVALVVATIIDGVALCGAAQETYKKHDRLKTAERRVTNAVEASSDYEMELIERESSAPSLAGKGTGL